VRKQRIISILALMVAALFSCIVLAQTPDSSSVTKAQAASTTPDFTGVWSQIGTYTFDPTDPRGAKAASLPMTAWGLEKFNFNRPAHGAAQTTNSNDPVNRCFPPGVPRVYLQPYPMEIVQLPTKMLQIFEYDHTLRYIYTDGRQHPKDPNPSYMGDSIGHWEGDTLVVDVVGFNDRTWIDRVGHPHSSDLHVVERFRRVDHETLQDDITIEDPKAYPRPWTGQKTFKLKPWEVVENSCADNVFFDEFQKKSIAEPGK